MKKFEFSLQEVLKVKGIREKERQRDLAQATQIYEQHVQRLNQMRREETDTFLTIHRLHALKPSPVLINTLYQNLAGRQTMRQLQVEAAEEALRTVNQKRQLLVTASRDKKILEKLKEKHYTEYIQASEKEEQNFLDEVAIIQKAHENIQE